MFIYFVVGRFHGAYTTWISLRIVDKFIYFGFYYRCLEDIRSNLVWLVYGCVTFGFLVGDSFGLILVCGVVWICLCICFYFVANFHFFVLILRIGLRNVYRFIARKFIFIRKMIWSLINRFVGFLNLNILYLLLFKMY